MKTLKQFIADTKGKAVAVSWGYKGQCVSLVQRYLVEVFGYPEIARGNAHHWEHSLIREGIAKKVTQPQYGDIIVYGTNYGGGYGHVAIYLTPTTLYDQNNFSHSNGLAGVGAMLPNHRVYLRLNRPLPSEEEKTIEQLAQEVLNGVHDNGQARRDSLGSRYNEVQKRVNEILAQPNTPKPKKEYLQLSSRVTSWNIYPLNKPARVGNEIGRLLPSRFGGLEYEILDRPSVNVATIQTRDFGKVNIYIGKETAHKIVVK